MADLRPQYNEEAVGANHPTKDDVINRAWDVEHEEDGTHKAGVGSVTFLSTSEALAGSESAKSLAADTLKAVRAVDASFWGIKNLRLIKAKSGDNTRVQVNPDGMNIALNVGDHYHIMTAAVDVDVADDLDTGAVAAGTDYYVYACTDGTNLTFKVSAASTYPSTHDAAHSRKIGGFHTLCVAVGNIAGHSLANFAVKDILPASVWCLKHRTKNLVNAGMVWSDKLMIWVDIYLASGTSALSVYNATTADTRNLMDFIDNGRDGNKRLPTDPEFQIYAFGTPESLSVAGAADPVTTGGHNNSAGSRIISNIGCEDCCGCWWQWLDPYFGANGLGAGGGWGYGASSGSRCRTVSVRSTAGTNVGARFVAEPL